MKSGKGYKISIGVDIERIERFSLDRRARKTFLERIYTNKELDYCFSKKNFAAHLAARFAGKEAVYKAMSGVEREPVSYKEIEINSGKAGAPKVKILNREFDTMSIAVSLSHSSRDAIAFAVVGKKT